MNLPLRKHSKGSMAYTRTLKNKMEKRGFLILIDEYGNYSFCNGEVTLRVLLPKSENNFEDNLKILITGKTLDEAVDHHIFEVRRRDLETDKGNLNLERLMEEVGTLLKRFS